MYITFQILMSAQAANSTTVQSMLSASTSEAPTLAAAMKALLILASTHYILAEYVLVEIFSLLNICTTKH